jgi:hypothetical protein
MKRRQAMVAAVGWERGVIGRRFFTPWRSFRMTLWWILHAAWGRVLNKTTAIVVLAVLSLVAACGPAAPTPTPTPEPTPTPVEVRATQPEHLKGLWFDGQGQRYVRFDSDGTVRSAANPEDLDEESSVAMTYWFEEGLHYVGPGLYWQGIGVYKG